MHTATFPAADYPHTPGAGDAAAGSVPRRRPAVVTVLVLVLALVAAAACAPIAATPPAYTADRQPAPADPAPAGLPASTPTPESPPARLQEKLASITGEAYVVIDGATGRTLLEYNARARRSPASLTKIMTALLVLERAGLDDVVIVSDAITTLRASTLMGLDRGERIPIRDLLYGLMLPSGNDAGVALAAHLAGTEQAFVRLMNAKARELGLADTYFSNSHGLDFREFGSPYSSARDLAQLSRIALQNPVFREVVSARSYVSRAGDVGPYLLVNYNSLLNSYPGANGVKIGYTRRAGHSIAASAWRDGVWLVAVVLGSTSSTRDSDAARLLDEGFRLARE